MKSITCLIIIGVGLCFHGVRAADASPSPRLTVEMRDGSRVVGQCVEDTVSVHSAAIGNLKLAWASIRSLEYASSSDTARLTATNGDKFAVQLDIDTLHLQTDFGKTELPVKMIRNIKVTPETKRTIATATAAVSASDFRLTIELRDGSHLVGKGLDDALNFHSPTMGDLKLTWAGIRSIIFASEKSPTARLTTTNGDAYEVEFVTPAVRVETSFGKNELPVKSIRSIKVSAIGNTAAASHLIGWWKLDDGHGTVAKDHSSIESPHDGTLVNEPQWIKTPGHSEAALFLNGASQYVSLGNILQGSYPEISIACWVKHSTAQWQNIVERGSWADPDGIGLMMDYNTTSVSFGHYSIVEATSVANVQDNRWHHVAGTLRQSGSDYVYSIYVDGKLDNTATNSTGLTATSKSWAIGARYDGTWAYRGLVKDVRIYDCALADADVQAIFAEQNSDELPTSPAASEF